MTLQILQTMIDKTGVCALGIHDSFIMPDIYEDVLADVMRLIAAEHKLPDIKLKTSRTPNTPHLLP